MENTATLTISKEKAKVLYGEYLEVVKTRKERYLADLKKTYYHLSKGHKVLDIFDAFKGSGVNKDGEPNLAISVAGRKEVIFFKGDIGSGVFSDSGNGKWGTHREDVILPSNVFPDWETKAAPTEYNKDKIDVVRETIKTKVPIVPAHLLPPGKLDNYYILFEVERWNTIPVPKDPFLLKRINANAFVVLAEWDVTDIEMAVIRGL